MIREIGSVYDKVEFVRDRVYLTVDGVDYALENEWVKFTYKVTKKGDVVVKATLATHQEIEQEKRIRGIIELDRELEEEMAKLKENVKELKDKAKVKFNELKEKCKEKFNK